MLKLYFENVGTQHYHFLLRRWWPAAGQGSGPAAWSRQRAGAAAAVAGGGARQRRVELAVRRSGGGGCRRRRRAGAAGRLQVAAAARRKAATAGAGSGAPETAAARSPVAAGSREGMGNGRVRVGLGRSNECRLLHESQIVKGGEKKSSETYIELAVESGSTAGRVLLLEREGKNASRRCDAIMGYHNQPSSKPQPSFWAPVLIQNKWKRSSGLEPLGPKEEKTSSKKQLLCEKNRTLFFHTHLSIGVQRAQTRPTVFQL